MPLGHAACVVDKLQFFRRLFSGSVTCGIFVCLCQSWEEWQVCAMGVEGGPVALSILLLLLQLCMSAAINM